MTITRASRTKATIFARWCITANTFFLTLMRKMTCMVNGTVTSIITRMHYNVSFVMTFIITAFIGKTNKEGKIFSN
jgi:hypothetical protein